jgi:hypothetical protein
LRSSGGTTSLEQARPKFTGFTEETKAEVFWSKKIFQVQEEEWKLRRELQLPLDQLERKRSGPLSLHPGSSRRRAHRIKRSGPSDLGAWTDSHRIQGKLHEV